jgi:two-component system, chemotaxis family, response regulator Rcp1
MEESNPEKFILLVEDNLERAQLIAEAIKAQSPQHRVTCLADGGAAIEFLQHCSDANPRPDLILLELNLPGKDGREVLAEIKASNELRRIPIVVLTTAASTADVFTTYALQGNCHVVKSTDLEQLVTIVRRIEEFWLGIVTLPLG